MNGETGEKGLKKRIRSGCVSRQDVTRRLAELAFGKANDCVRLALEDAPDLGKLDLSLLSEVKRNEKGTVASPQARLNVKATQGIPSFARQLQR